MASLSIARPGKVSERQYLGDLAGLFERQRRRSGLALTPDSFAADLSANDSLRSGLFTLCTAISHMGESDLSSQELLDLVARALGGAGSAEGETGTPVPMSMSEAFLSGYEAWRNRDLQPIESAEPEVWPPVAPGARKPPAREAAPEAFVQAEATTGGVPSELPVVGTGRKSVQEAISLARRERSDAETHDLQSAPGRSEENLGNMTLGEIKNILQEIEDRVVRLGPQLHQMSPARRSVQRERPLSQSAVIPFPESRSQAVDDDPHSSGFDLDAFVRSRPDAAARLQPEDAALAHVTGPDDRPRGIDALLAAAPAWANATPTARSFDEEAFLARHAYLAPTRRPGAEAPASLYYAETPAQALVPPTATLPQTPLFMPLVTPIAATASAPPPLIGLDSEDEPLLSPMERLQAAVLRLPPRQVFISLAGLTVLAGGLAGLIAYHTLHPRIPRFTDLEPAVQFGGPPTPVFPYSSVSSNSAPARVPAPVAAPAPRLHEPTAAAASAKPAPAAPLTKPPTAKPHTALAHLPPVAVWPPAPQPPAPQQAASQTSSQPATDPGLLYVPASTMIGYVLASPQPSYPTSTANGVSGTVAVAVTVSRAGTVTSARAVSGPPELRAAATSAVHGWRFRPFLASGAPTEVTTTLQFYFKGD